MARLMSWMALAVAAAVVVGCGPAKELPDEVPKAPDAGEKPVAAVPAVSDPAAKNYLDHAVKAYTGGKPELATKGQASRRTLRGTRIIGNDPRPIETVQTEAAVYPDRYHAVVDMQLFGARSVLRTWLRRPHIVALNGDQEQPFPNAAQAEQELAGDETAQLWMPLFLPLTDPKAVVFDHRKGTIGQQPVETLKLSLRDLPVYTLSFDAKSAALVRVEYTTKAPGVEQRKAWTLVDHKTGPEGLLLPGRAELQINKAVVELWVVEKWEFPASIDDAEFSPPKK